MNRLKKHTVIGMAGHIDHGKTELVKALTGTDTDRLKEEKERGMTTDLGFAFLGNDITIIDVPGHEKFVKTMVAGVNTVDLAVLVIAADDGVMPQTTEHLDILNLLHISSGVIAVTKTDLVDKEWLKLVIEDIQALVKDTKLAKAPIIPVSPITGDNIDTLRKTIFQQTEKIPSRTDKGIFRMPIDRVFSIRGFGTIVAGTIISGEICSEDMVELLPLGKHLRIRGIQVHEKEVDKSTTGFRTAVNLAGIEKDNIERGDVLAEPGFYRPSYMLDCQLLLLKSCKKNLKNRTRVRVHISTTEVMGRVVILNKDYLSPGKEAFIQLRLEKPVVADRGDRFVIRSYSPVYTIGGGIILDVNPQKHKRFDDSTLNKLDRLLEGDSAQIIQEYLQSTWFTPASEKDIARSVKLTEQELIKILQELNKSDIVVKVDTKGWILINNLKLLKSKIINQLEDFFTQNPLRLSMNGAEIRSKIKQPVDKYLFDFTCRMLENENEIKIKGEKLTLKDHTVKLSNDMTALKKDIENEFLENPLKPPKLKSILSSKGEKAESIIRYMSECGELVRIEEDLFIHKKAIENAREIIENHLKKNDKATVSEIKQLLSTSRKYALPLLVYFDSIGLTERDGDMRKLKE